MRSLHSTLHKHHSEGLGRGWDREEGILAGERGEGGLAGGGGQGTEWGWGVGGGGRGGDGEEVVALRGRGCWRGRGRSVRLQKHHSPRIITGCSDNTAQTSWSMDYG